MRDDSNKAEATTAFKGNLILFSYHIKRREVLTFQPTTGLLHKHFKLCFSIIQLCIPLIHVCRLHQTPFPPLWSPLHLPALWKNRHRELSGCSLHLQKWPCFEELGCAEGWQWCHSRKGQHSALLSCNPSSQDRSKCVLAHGEWCSSMLWVVAVIHCWIGMAVQSTRVGQAHWVLAVAPPAIQDSFGYPDRKSVV